MPRLVAVIGAGSFGTAMARIIGEAAQRASSDCKVLLWTRRAELAEEINSTRMNSKYFSGAELPDTVTATSSLAEVAEADVQLFVVPHQHLEAVLEEMPASKPSAVVVSLMKGVYFRDGSLVRISSVLRKARGCPQSNDIAFLAGPNLFSDMAEGLWAEATLACSQEQRALLMQVLSVDAFSVEWTHDVAGAEMLSVLKNCYSLGSGMLAGLGHRMNGRSAALRHGLLECRRFLRELSAGNEDTVWAACGLADFTLTSLGGRGQRLAAEFVRRGGETPWKDLENELLEGQAIPDLENLRAVTAAVRAHVASSEKPVNGTAAQHGFPLLEQIHRVAFEGAPAGSLVDVLRARSTSAAIH